MKLDPNKPKGEICGPPPMPGARYVQNKLYFNADGECLNPPKEEKLESKKVAPKKAVAKKAAPKKKVFPCSVIGCDNVIDGECAAEFTFEDKDCIASMKEQEDEN